MSPEVAQACRHSRPVLHWQMENCCETKEGEKVPCAGVTLENLRVSAREGHRHWVFEPSIPPVGIQFYIYITNTFTKTVAKKAVQGRIAVIMTAPALFLCGEPFPIGLTMYPWKSLLYFRRYMSVRKVERRRKNRCKIPKKARRYDRNARRRKHARK